MPQVATITSLPAAFRMMKAMQAEGVEWGEDYRTAVGRAAVVDVLEPVWVCDRSPSRAHGRARPGRPAQRHYRRWLLTELGQIELSVPRTRRFSPSRWCAPTPAVPPMSIA